MSKHTVTDKSVEVTGPALEAGKQVATYALTLADFDDDLAEVLCDVAKAVIQQTR